VECAPPDDDDGCPLCDLTRPWPHEGAELPTKGVNPSEQPSPDCSAEPPQAVPAVGKGPLQVHANEASDLSRRFRASRTRVRKLRAQTGPETYGGGGADSPVVVEAALDTGPPGQQADRGMVKGGVGRGGNLTSRPAQGRTFRKATVHRVGEARETARERHGFVKYKPVCCETECTPAADSLWRLNRHCKYSGHCVQMKHTFIHVECPFFSDDEDNCAFCKLSRSRSSDNIELSLPASSS